MSLQGRDICYVVYMSGELQTSWCVAVVRRGVLQSYVVVRCSRTSRCVTVVSRSELHSRVRVSCRRASRCVAANRHSIIAQSTQNNFIKESITWSSGENSILVFIKTSANT